MLAAYGFSEGTGTVTADASGSAINGTLNGAVWTAGRNGSGLSFNGTSSFVSLGNAPALALTGSMTVSAWVNESANVGDDGIIVSRSSGSGGWELKSSPDTGSRTFAFGVYSTSGAYAGRYSKTVRALGAWYHVAGVYDAPTRALHVYVNGTLDDGFLWGTVPSSLSAPAVNANVGMRSAGFNIKAVIDDLRVYGRALTQAEIQSDMASSVGGAAGDTIPPSVPSGLSIAAVSSSRVDLAWTASTDNVAVAGYRVYRDGSAIATSAGTAFSDTGLSASTSYTYAVAAFDAAGNESAPSAAVPATTPAPPPADVTPPNVALTAPAANAIVGGASVAVSATASDDVAVAGVQFLLDGVPLGAEDTASPWSIVWNTAGTTSGAHVLSARARDAAGNVGSAAGVPIVVDNEAPVGSIAINGGAAATRSTAVTLTLSATGAVTRMRFSNTGTSFTAAEAFATTKAWTLTSGAGTKTVYAQFGDAAGNWSASFSDTIVLDTTAPVVSAVVATGIGGSGATITWTTDEPSSSRVEYGKTTSFGAMTPPDPALTTSHAVVLSGLSPVTRYYYRVRSADAAGNERLGSRYSFTTGNLVDTTAPSVPAALSARAVSSAAIGLSWTASTDDVGVAGYTIYRDGVQVGTVTSGTSWTDSGLAPETSYLYAVSAYDRANNRSAQCAPVTGTTLPDTTPPSVPIGLLALPSSSSRIDLSWSASTDDVAVTGYAVFRDGGQIASATGPAYADSGLGAATTHSYAVAAYDAKGNLSAQSETVTATTLPVISVSPSASTVSLGGSQAFTCAVSLDGDTSCSWSIAEGAEAGSIVSTGPNAAIYTAPATPGIFHVIATSNADPERSSAATVAVVNAATPTLVQHIASSTNPIGISGNAGNDFRFTLPNAVGTGNCLVLGISYGWSATRTVTVTDDNGNVWPATPAATVTDRNNLTSSIFVLPNAQAGRTRVTVTFDSTLYNFQYALSEFYNVDATSPFNGSSASSSTTTTKGTTNLSSGIFTPAANNDAAGGNLIWTYFASNSDGSSHTVTNWTAGPGFRPLHSDIGWHDQGMPTASEYTVQATQAAIDPSISVTSGGADTYNAVSLALKAAWAGTPPSPDGIRIVRQNISSLGNFTGVTAWTVQFPCVGNLLVLTTPQASVMPTTSVTDSVGNTWVKYAPDDQDPQIWYVANATPDPNLQITFHMRSAPTGAQTALLYDITGADPNPLDAHAEKLNANVTTTHLSDSPVITPGSPNGLTIAAVTLGQGPISQLDVGAPEGAVFDYVYYTNEIDTDLMDNADGRAHFYNPDLTPEHWNWLLVGPTSNNNYASVAVHFKAAPPRAQPSPAPQARPATRVRIAR